MININRDIVADDPEWVVRIVGDEGERRRPLETFTDPEQSSPVAATTSRLLSTGVDIPDLKHVVLFRPIGSPVEFKQIIGRGSRPYPDKGKTSFEIIDFVGATSHFAGPDFDGYPAQIIDVTADGSGSSASGEPDEPGPDMVGEPQPPFSPVLRVVPTRLPHRRAQIPTTSRMQRGMSSMRVSSMSSQRPCRSRTRQPGSWS